MSITLTSKTSYDYRIDTSTMNADGSWTGWAKHSSSLSGQFNNIRVTGDNLVDYRRRIANHESATTGLQGTRYSIRGEGGGGFAKYESFSRSNGARLEGAQAQGVLAVNDLLSAPGNNWDTSYISNRALQNFAQDCFQKQHTLQGMVVLGELGSTLKAIRSPLKALYHGIFEYFGALNRVSRGRSRRHRAMNNAVSRDAIRGEIGAVRASMTRAVTGTYLEAVFGWQPLLRDIDSAAKAAARIVTYRPPTESVRGSARDTRFFTPLTQDKGFGNAFVIKTHAARWATFRKKYYGVLINKSGWDGTLPELGFDLRSFVPSIWQLLPYSFLVDYFTNLGAIIEAASFNRALLAWANHGSRLDDFVEVTSCTCQFGTPPPAFQYARTSFRPGSNPGVRKSQVSRNPFIGTIVPDLYFEIPGLGMRWMNIGALLAQASATSRGLALG